MPHVTSGITQRLLPPDELLILAHDLECQEMYRYLQLARGFLTYSLGIGQLMAALSIACEHRLDRLHQATSWWAPAELPPPLHSSFTEPDGSVTDRGTAIDVLTRAIAAAEYTHRCSAHLRDINTIAELQPLLVTTAKQRETEYRLLGEALASCDGWIPPPQPAGQVDHTLGVGGRPRTWAAQSMAAV